MATHFENNKFKDFLLSQVIDLPPYPLDDILDWIKSTLSPNDVFDTDDLEQWAVDNNFELKK